MTARRSLWVLAALTALCGFGLGFALAVGGASKTPVEDLAAQADGASTTTARLPPSTRAAPVRTAPPTTEATTTTEAPTTTTTAVPTTVASTLPVPPTTVATTQPPVVVTVAPPPTTLAPPRVQVTYAADRFGRLMLPRSGYALLTLTNRGGQASQWLITGTGFRTAGSGSAQGTLAPGQTATVTVQAPSGELPDNEITGVIQVLGAVNSAVPFVIPKA